MTALAPISAAEARRRIEAATGAEWARVETILRDHARDHGRTATVRRVNAALQHLAAELREEGIDCQGWIR